MKSPSCTTLLSMCSSRLVVTSYLSNVTPFQVGGSSVSIISARKGFRRLAAREMLLVCDGQAVPPMWLACGMLDTSIWNNRQTSSWEGCGSWFCTLKLLLSCCNATMSSTCFHYMFTISSRSTQMASTIDLVATMLFLGYMIVFLGPIVGTKMYLHRGKQVILFLMSSSWRSTSSTI